MTENTDKNQVSTATPNRLPNDADDAHVAEILKGAYRGPRDPDVSLAAIIVDLRAANEEAIRSALAMLVKNADSD